MLFVPWAHVDPSGRWIISADSFSRNVRECRKRALKFWWQKRDDKQNGKSNTISIFFWNFMIFFLFIAIMTLIAFVYTVHHLMVGGEWKSFVDGYFIFFYLHWIPSIGLLGMESYCILHSQIFFLLIDNRQKDWRFNI